MIHPKEKAKERNDCPVEKYLKTQTSLFIEYNILNPHCTDCCIAVRIVLYTDLLNETERVRKCFQGNKKPTKTRVVTLKYCKCMS